MRTTHRIRRCNAVHKELEGYKRLLAAVFADELALLTCAAQQSWSPEEFKSLQGPTPQQYEPVPEWVMFYRPEPDPALWD